MSIKASLFFMAFLLIACSQPAKRVEKNAETITEHRSSVKTGYDFLHPKNSWSLPDELKEISGLEFIDNTHFVAIEDLRPLLYILRTDFSAVVERIIPFKQTDKEKYDIEDVTIKQDTIYTIWSHGKIFQVSNWTKNPVVQSFTTSLTKENNAEGLCYDPLSNNLLIAYKNKSGVEGEKSSTRAIYAFDLRTDSMKVDPFLLIHKKDFEKLDSEKIDFFPSAIAVNPMTNDIFILSTRENKCVAVYDRSGKLKSFDLLDNDLLPQPEGICFSPDGRLFVSSQGKHGKAAAIYEFAAVK